ncbi:MAG: hypothetical protein ABI771_15695 [Betaproteobacteria bacterium]
MKHFASRSVCGIFALWIALSCQSDAIAQDFLAALDNKLSYASADGGVRANLSLMGDLTLFAADQPAQGLLFTTSDTFLAPRLSAFLDVQIGDRLLLHGQARADRGFDPGAESSGDVRMDEYFLQYRASSAGQLNLRAGKYATVFGSWAPRSLAWENPLITAPGPYDTLIPITSGAAPASPAAFATRRDVPAVKATWSPIIWGAAYGTGAAVLGRIGDFEYAAELKNVALSSPPDTWDGLDYGFQSRPATTLHLGYLPAPEWTLGASVSRGPYLQDSARASLPGGASLNDFYQTTWGLDAGYAHRDWQVWSELIHAAFDVPRVGQVNVLSGYVEVRYKINAEFWTVVRANQSWFGDVPGSSTSWDRNMTSVDVGVGYRVNARTQAKFQYGFSREQGPQNEGNHLLALQLVVRL